VLACDGDAVKACRCSAAFVKGPSPLTGATLNSGIQVQAKKQYQATIGHRQNFTRVQVDEIVA